MGEVAIFSKGVGYSKSDLKDSGIPIILYGRLYTNYEIVIEDVDTFVDGIFGVVYSKGGEIITPSSGETSEDISIASVVKKSGILIGGDLNIIYPQSFLNPIFIAVSISNGKPHKEMAKRAQGKSVVHLHNVDLSEIEIDYPSIDEQTRISSYFITLDRLITLHQSKSFGHILKVIVSCTLYWEQRKFSDLYEKVMEKNDLSFGTDKIISVASMHYKEDTSNSDDDYMRTYNVMRLGDIAFEGNKSKNFAHGRFVENTIGDGIVSHVFDVFRPISEYDLLFWKYFINYEGVMGRIMIRCTKASTMMTNLVAKDFLEESIVVPSIVEQKRIGYYLKSLDHLITLHQLEPFQLIFKAIAYRIIDYAKSKPQRSRK